MSDNTNAKWQTRGTWVLAIIALIAIWFSECQNRRYIAEVRDNMNRQWRPFIKMLQQPKRAILSYCYNEDVSSASDCIPINTVAKNSREYKGYDFFCIQEDIIVEFINKGNSPARITDAYTKGMSSAFWKDTLKESYEELVNRIQKELKDDTWKTDVYVWESDTFRSANFAPYLLLPISSFESIVDKNQNLIFYYYTYVEYESIYGNRYSTISIDGKIIDQFSLDSNNTVKYRDQQRILIEKQRFDVGLD
jgi:hypothetical protein